MPIEMHPIFVIGVNGSGTTMLADALGRHPELYMLPWESRVLPYFARRYSDATLQAPNARRALANELGASRAWRRANGGKPVTIPHAEDLAPHFAAVAGALYLSLASSQSKSRWGDKSPMYLQHIDLLARRFPDARFVHIFRDARDAARSFHRRWAQEPRRTVYRWKKGIRAGRHQGAALGSERYMELAYEELTAYPESHMRAVCAFCGLSFAPEVLDSGMRQMEERDRIASQGRIIQNSGRWKTYFTPDQIGAQERIAGALLRDLGYEAATNGDEDPLRARLVWWTVLDRVRRVKLGLARHGIGGLPDLMRQIRDARRQNASNKF